MSENIIKLEINDLFVELREENNRLLSELFFAQKCIKLLESYRNCLKTFNNNCNCHQNIANQILFNGLENDYKYVFSHQNLVEIDCDLIDTKNHHKFRENTIKTYSTINKNSNKRRFKSKLKPKKDEKHKALKMSYKTDEEIETLIDSKSDKHFDCNKSNNKLIKYKSFRKNKSQLNQNLNNNKREKESQKESISDYETNNWIQFCCNYNDCEFKDKSLDLFEKHIDKSHSNFNSEPKHNKNYSFRRKQFFKLNKSYVKFKCEWSECEFQTNNFVYINQHILRHTGNKLFVCEWPGCESKFVNKNELTSHQNNRHRDCRPFSCDFNDCHQKFKTKSHLRTHLRIHSGDKPYVCEWPGCESVFGDSSKLNRHKLIHNGIKNFTCNWPECDKKFMTPFSLKRHLLIHSGVKPFKCVFNGCEKRFNDSGNMKKHFRVHKTNS